MQITGLQSVYTNPFFLGPGYIFFVKDTINRKCPIRENEAFEVPGGFEPP